MSVGRIKITISEARAEQLADIMVQNRLEQSSAYRHAEDAEAQYQAEGMIEQQVWRELEEKYNII